MKTERASGIDRPAGCEGLLTTGQAARFLSVKPDTVLKWIRAGKLPAARTAGGHNRIAAADIERMLAPGQAGRPPLYCWEFFHAGEKPLPRCLTCPAYRFRASRCFEVRRSGLAMPDDFDGCPPSCESCAFFAVASPQRRRLLLVTADPGFRAQVERLAQAAFEMRCAGSPYEAASMIEDFRPAVVLVDTAGLPRSVWKPLLRELLRDPRLSAARVALLAKEPGLPAPAAEVLPRRLTLRQLNRFAAGRPRAEAGSKERAATVPGGERTDAKPGSTGSRAAPRT